MGIKDTRIISVSRTVVVSSRTVGQDNMVVGPVVDTAARVATGIRIRSKILNTRSKGSTARAKLRVTISRVDRPKKMTRTRTRTRGPPTRLRTRTRCRRSSTGRMHPAAITTAATNLISIPTKRGKITTKNQDFSRNKPLKIRLNQSCRQMHSQLSAAERDPNKFIQRPTCQPCPSQALRWSRAAPCQCLCKWLNSL